MPRELMYQVKVPNGEIIMIAPIGTICKAFDEGLTGRECMEIKHLVPGQVYKVEGMIECPWPDIEIEVFVP